MFKKILGLILAATLAVCPVASFAGGEEAVTFPLVQDFNDRSLEGWLASGGAVEFSADDYGYLKFTTNSAAAVLSKELGIDSGAFTVDFRIKAESESGTATVSVGGMELALNLAEKTLAGKDFIPKLWYDVRVASDGTTANVYLDAAVVSTGNAITYENIFKITADAGMIIGIDDFKVYNENKEAKELKSTPLDFKFDGFEFVNDSEGTKAWNTSESVNIESTKLDKVLGTADWTNGGQGYNIVNAINFSLPVNISAVGGKFGKSTDDKGIYYNHTASDNKSYSNSTLDFNIGKYGWIKNTGDKQIVSFNMAFEDDFPQNFILRSYNIYSTTGFLGAQAGYTTDVKGDGGWLIKIAGDRMYIFSNSKYYSIRPAILPNQWNNIRLEMKAGNAGIGSSTGIAMIISVYVNDIPIAENIEVSADKYFVSNHSGTVSTRGRFQGIHRLAFNYNWSNEWNSANGIYLDDVKIENYYSGADYQEVKSPLLVEENGTLDVEEDGTVDEVSDWNHDKWVQGGVVYVDSEQTIASYVEKLPKNRNLGIIFRDGSGNVIDDLNTKFGQDTIYAEIIRSEDYSRIYASFIGKQTAEENFAQDGSSSTAFGTWAESAKNVWNTQNTTISVAEAAKGGRSANDKSLAFSQADGQTSNFRTKFAFLSKLSAGYTYDSADDFRPITVGASVLMEDTTSATFQMGAWYAPGPLGAYVNESNTAIADGSKENMIIKMQNGNILNQSNETLGSYKANEWNRVEITFFPAYPEYRVDIHINGKTVAYRYIVKADSMYQAISWFLMKITGKVYIDDLTAVTGYYKPSEASAVESNNHGTIDALSDSEFLTASGKSAEEVKTALNVEENGRIYTDNFYATEQSGNVVTGNKLVVQDGKILKYFDLNTSDFVVADNTVKSLARNNADKLCVALYTEEGVLDSIQWINAEKKGIVESPAFAENIKSIRMFLWNSALAPYVSSQSSTVNVETE